MKNETLLKRTNELARTFYSLKGYEVPKDFKFYERKKNTHPDEAACWFMACHALLQLKNVNMRDILDELEIEDEFLGFLWNLRDD